MINKTIEELRADIIESYNDRLPDLDLTEGTPERDIFVEAPIAGYLSPAWDAIVYTQKLHAPLTYYPELAEEDINNFIATYGVYPLDPAYSSGTIIFYTYNQPTRDIEISPKTRVATYNTNVEFEVVGYYILYSSIADSYYNATSGRWEITCNIKAVNPGPTYSGARNTITKIVTSISGIEGCINTAGVYGGTAVESIISRVTRAKGAFQGKGLGSTLGLESFVRGICPSANIVRANDSIMLRDDQNGGCVDIYIKEVTIATYTESFVVTAQGLALGINTNYTATSLLLTKQPVHTLVSLLDNDVAVVTSNYILSVDSTSVLKKSTRGYDKVVPSVGSPLTFQAGHTYTVTYTYNSLLYSLEATLNLPINHYDNRDVLAREQTPVAINVYMRINPYSGQDFDTVAARVESLVANYLTALDSTKVEIVDVITVAKSDLGVDNIDKTTATLTCASHTADSHGDITLARNEYVTVGTITIATWS